MKRTSRKAGAKTNPKDAPPQKPSSKSKPVKPAGATKSRARKSALTLSAQATKPSEPPLPVERPREATGDAVTKAVEKATPSAVPSLAKPRPAKRRITTPPRPREAELKVPSILLEGDLPPAPAISGPGTRYALAPQAITPAGTPGIGELPQSYGTGRIFLAARDPHWLFASWDFAQEQQKELNARSRDGHLILRVFAEGEDAVVIPEVHVHPESRHWFLSVPRAETRYRVEIGLYKSGGEWRSVSVSQSTFTPPEAPSEDVTAEFATIPPQISFKQVAEAVQQFVASEEGRPLLEAVVEAQKQERAEIRPHQETPQEKRGSAPIAPPPRPDRRQPQPASAVYQKREGEGRRSAIPIRIEPGRPWKPAQRAALKRLIQMDELRRVWLGSIEITELVRRQLEEEIASIAAIEGRGVPPGLRGEEIPAGAVSSPFGGELRRARKFWFKVNAELIVYGATEPDAKVTIAERLIKLRPDGTFSSRFSLPDGRYQLPARAVSGDGEEAREARLEFARSTEYRGEIEAHPQDAALRPPRAEHVQ